MRIHFYLSNYKKWIRVQFYLDSYLNKNVFITHHKRMHIILEHESWLIIYYINIPNIKYASVGEMSQ